MTVIEFIKSLQAYPGDIPIAIASDMFNINPNLTTEIKHFGKMKINTVVIKPSAPLKFMSEAK